MDPHQVVEIFREVYIYLYVVDSCVCGNMFIVDNSLFYKFINTWNK